MSSSTFSQIHWTNISGTNNYQVKALSDNSAPVSPGYITLGGVKSGSTSNLEIYAAGGRDIIMSSNNVFILGNLKIGNKISFSGGEAIIPLGNSYWIGTGLSSGNRLRIHHNGSNAYIDFLQNIYFRANGATTNFTILSNGYVGIGTSDPKAQLAVKGKILAEEFEIVTNVNQPDYVFDASYNLKPLSEVEQFIQSNKHLPDVPSAAHAKENGYKIVEMDNALLRKVEELTLYVIELNKQLEATKAELAEVKGGN